MNRIPVALQAQMKAAQQRWLAIETGVALLGGLCGLMASYLLLFVSDRFWSTPAALRMLFTATGVAGAGLGAWWWASHFRRRRDPRATAILIQKRYPRLGDRLLSIVELAQAEQLPANVSPTLVNAAMRQVAADSRALDFDSAVPTRWLRRWLPAAVFIVALVLGAAVLTPAAGWTGWKRWARPLGREARFTFARLKPLPATQVVAYGEPFGLTARLKDGSNWRPASGRARVGRQAPVKAALKGDEYPFAMPGQTRADRLALAVGDAHETIRVEPMFRPELAALSATIMLPSYLEYPPLQVDVRKGAIDLLDGSQVRFAGRVSRPLREATLAAAGARTLAVQGDAFGSENLALDRDTKVVSFAWHDAVGLSGHSPFALKLKWREDDAPRVDCRGLERATAILEDETIEFRIEAEDDYGVKKAGVKWQTLDPVTGLAPADKSLPGGAYDVLTGRPQALVLDGSTRFSPRTLGIGPGRVALYATAVDYKPGREPVQSAAYLLLVLDRADHARLVQQQMDRIAQQIEELARTEQLQTETTQRLRDELAKLTSRDAGAPPPADLQKQLDKLTEQLRAEKQEEQANREAAQQAAEDIRKLMKEALRNDQISSEIMKQMAEVMRALQQVMQGEMQQAEQSLQNAQQASAESQSGQRSEQMRQAQKEQQDALEKLRELAKQLQKNGENLMAETFVNRLKAAARSEREIGGELEKISPQTLGAALAQLTAPLRERLLGQKSRQESTQRKVREIKTDIGSFLRRRPIQELYDVRTEMDKVNVTEELTRLAGMIGVNQTIQAIEQTGRWEKQLLAWAEMISKRKDGGGGGGGEGQEMPAWLIELIMRVARVRQQEEDLREQTRALDERRADNPRYVELARELESRQDQLLTDFDQIPEAAKVPAAVQMQLAGLFEAVDTAMADAILTLRKPDTGAKAIGAQTEVIELLGATLEQAGGGGGQMSPQQMAMMQQMMRMMGMGGGGQSPGGNPMGGGTDKTSPIAFGRGDGAAGDPRRVEQAGGRDTASLPAEFREALDGFFNAMEKNK